MLNPYKNKCPCGSNKRYIDCCLISPKFWNRILDRQKIATSLRWKIIDFATSTLSEETEEALCAYFQNSYSKPADIPDEQMGAFIDWFIHDYQLPDTGSSVLGLFFEKRYRLEDVERFLTSGWLTSYNNCYLTIEINPGYWLIVQDIVTGEQFLLANPELSEMTPPWSIFVGRIVSLGEVFEFDFIHHTLPPTAFSVVKSTLISTYENRQLEFNNLSYRSYMQHFLSPILPRLIDEAIQLDDLLPTDAFHTDLLPYKEFFHWLCVSFFDENLIDKPADFEVIVQELTKTDTLDKAFSSWPGDFTGNTEELESFLSWLEFIDACMVIHYGKQPPFDFSEKSQLLGLEKPVLPTFKPLAITRTKINEESQALEKISSVLHNHMKNRYPDKQIEAAILLWQHYLGVTNELPDIRKPATWAAAVEYCLIKLLSLPITQKEIAEEYAVSSSSVSRISKIISSRIDLDSLDKSSFLR